MKKVKKNSQRNYIWKKRVLVAYDDDVATLDPNGQDIKKTTLELIVITGKMGLRINELDQQQEIQIGNYYVEKVHTFIYIGTEFNSQNDYHKKKTSFALL